MTSTAIEQAQESRIVLVRDDELSVEEVVRQAKKVQEVMRALMKPDEHYGVIPGTSGPGGKPKPTLLKAGAEKLCLLFRLDPQYAAIKSWDGAHLTVESTCTLYHIPTGQRRGSGMGSCSTRESKYAYRKGARVCPKCQEETIIKGKNEYGGGWLCFAKKGGCGAKFKDGDASIEGQSTERVANDDLPDTYNTVLKMANKRSLVAAVLNVTAASDIFTQDLEDLAKFTPSGGGLGHSPHHDDEPGEVYRDPQDLVARLEMIETLIDAGEYVKARRALGSKAHPDAPGSITLDIQKEINANALSQRYRADIGKLWQRLNRKLNKFEMNPKPGAELSVEASFIDSTEDDIAEGAA